MPQPLDKQPAVRLSMISTTVASSSATQKADLQAHPAACGPGADGSGVGSRSAPTSDGRCPVRAVCSPRADAIEAIRISRQRACNGNRVSDFLGLAESLQWPPARLRMRSKRGRSPSDLVVAVCRRPLDDAGEHGECGQMQLPPSPPFSQRRVDAEPRALDHRRRGAE